MYTRDTCCACQGPPFLHQHTAVEHPDKLCWPLGRGLPDFVFSAHGTSAIKRAKSSRPRCRFCQACQGRLMGEIHCCGVFSFVVWAFWCFIVVGQKGVKVRNVIFAASVARFDGKEGACSRLFVIGRKLHHDCIMTENTCISYRVSDSKNALKQQAFSVFWDLCVLCRSTGRFAHGLCDGKDL